MQAPEKQGLPEPLLPADVDLRDYPDMLFGVQRFRDSSILSERSFEEIVAAMNLWCAAFHSTPCASLPANDIQLAKLAHYGHDVKRFRKIKQGALHGFILCSDGRLWHPIVAEKAVISWHNKVDNRYRRHMDRVRKFNAELRARGDPEVGFPATPYKLKLVDPDAEIPMWRYIDAAGRPAVANRKAHTADRIPAEFQRNDSGIPTPQDDGIPATEVKGMGKRSKWKGRETTDSPPSAPNPPLSKSVATAEKRPPPAEPKGAATWTAYSEAFMHRYGVAPLRNAKVNAVLANFVGRVGEEDAPAVAAFYLQSNRQLYVSATHAVDLLLRDAEALHTAWSTRRHATDTESRQIDRTQAIGNAFEEARRELKDAS